MTIYEDEFDLYPYVQTLLKNWKLILFLAIIAGAAAFVFSIVQPRTYSATSMIIGTYRRPVFTLSDEFSTITNNTDARNKHQAFLIIAKSDEIALRVYEKYVDLLPDEMLFEDFKDRVSVTDQGDAILVTASFEDPNLSAEVSNTWAVETVNAINAAYGDAIPLEPIQAQIAEARETYHLAQSNLETFIEENQISTVERTISEAQQVLGILQAAQLGVIDTHLSTQINLLSQQADQYFNTLSNQTQILFSSQVEEQFSLLNFYSQRRTQLEELLVQAEALKDQLDSGNRSIPGDTGDALALFLTRAQVFGIDNAATMEIAITDFTNLQDSESNYVADINNIIEQIEVELVKNNTKLEEISKLLESGGEYQYYEPPNAENPLFQAGMQSLNSLLKLDLPSSLTPDYEGSILETNIEEITNDIQKLQAKLEGEQARQREMENERDLAEQAYQALLAKETEIKAGSQTSNEVALAGSAVEPTRSDSRGTVMNTLLAGIVGAMVAVVWVFISTWWKSQVENEIVPDEIS